MTDEPSSSTKIEIGSIVRVPRAEPAKATGRAMVAEHHDADSVCLLWEPVLPKPLSGKYLILPSIQKESDQETIVMRKEIQSLLPFELTKDSADNVATIKDRGDQLLRLGDASAAAGYYETALQQSSHISVGSSIIVSLQGFPKVAEVDCMDGDNIEVAYVESGEEGVIPISSALIAILQTDPEHLQERILLNLSRCLLQLADVDRPNRPKYLKAAVLASTLVVALAQFHENEDGSAPSDTNNLPTNSQTALTLRVKAQIGLSKWPNASADAKRLLKAGNKQGKSLLETVERKKKQQGKLDKKLAKSVSRWVQTATSASVSNKESDDEQSHPTRADAASKSPDTSLKTQQPSFLLSTPMVCVYVLIVAILVQFILSANPVISTS